MTKSDQIKKDQSPGVKIALMNYEPDKQDEYAKRFMTPLISGLLQRILTKKHMIF
jgi:hypothetical protein